VIVKLTGRRFVCVFASRGVGIPHLTPFQDCKVPHARVNYSAAHGDRVIPVRTQFPAPLSSGVSGTAHPQLVYVLNAA